MLTKNLTFENFVNKKVNLKLKNYLKELISSKNEVINSLSKGYKYSYTKKSIKKLKGYKDIRIFGMGGSSLGTLAIYDFLRHKINKNFYFLTNLNQKIKFPKKKYLNLVISKSGNTLETIVNSNLYINKNDKNVLVSDNKKSILREISMKLKSDIIDHNNFIGGRYSVLSEVGMLPAELMGLDSRKFKKFDNLVANKKFLNSLSLMQLYLDGQKNNFYTFFYTKDQNYQKLNQDIIPGSLKFLKKKNLGNILHSKILATKKVFQKKKIPFRSFYLKSKNEEVLGELFTYFILETILLAKALKINPYDQPAVELIKIETKKILKSS